MKLVTWRETVPLPELPPPEVRRKLREAMRITIRDASMEIGVSTTSYAFWERGARTPRPGHWQAYYKQLYRWQETLNAEGVH